MSGTIPSASPSFRQLSFIPNEVKITVCLEFLPCLSALQRSWTTPAHSSQRPGSKLPKAPRGSEKQTHERPPSHRHRARLQSTSTGTCSEHSGQEGSVTSKWWGSKDSNLMEEGSQPGVSSTCCVSLGSTFPPLSLCFLVCTRYVVHSRSLTFWLIKHSQKPITAVSRFCPQTHKFRMAPIESHIQSMEALQQHLVFDKPWLFWTGRTIATNVTIEHPGPHHPTSLRPWSIFHSGICWTQADLGMGLSTAVC